MQQTFSSITVNKRDAKGRVSVPAPFRQILTQQNQALALQTPHGFHCFRSFQPMLEGYGAELAAELERSIGSISAFSKAYDANALVAIAGESDYLNFDDEGRVRLPDEFIAHAHITDRVLFVGMIKKFQMWDPVEFESMRRERRALALKAWNGDGA